MQVIGENINATNKKVAAAIAEKDEEFIAELAKAQDEAGADYIDVNSGAGQTDHKQALADMEWLVDIVQKTTAKPLALDSDDAEILKVAINKYQREDCIINSVTAESERLESVAPLAAERRALLVALAMGKGGIPNTVEKRLDACDIIMTYLDKLGMKPEQVLFDPLVLPVGVDNKQGMVTLKTLEAIKSRYPGVRSVMGLSNISFGLPLRKLVNRSFLLMAAYAGLDTVILNPLDAKIMSVVKVADMLVGKDPYCRKYTAANRKGLLVD
jgi:cobalamin-dependent methionine synthase I